MSEIELACHTGPWGAAGFINALADIERARFRGIEMTSEVVEQFEDRVGVFKEILCEHNLNLIAITAGGAMWPGMNLDEEVERGVNIARFLKNAGANILTLRSPIPNPDSPLEDELDLMPAATAYGEIARRTMELDVQTCLLPAVGSYIDSTENLKKFIEMADPEVMRVCADSGFLSLAKVPVASFIKEFRQKIGIVHLRDIKVLQPKPSKKKRPEKEEEGEKAQPETPPVRVQAMELGRGDLNLEEFVDALLKVEFVGWGTVLFDPARSKSLLELAKTCHHYAEHTLDLVF